MFSETPIKVIDNVLNYFKEPKQNIAILFIVSLQSDHSGNEQNSKEIVSSYSSDIELEEFVFGLKTFVSYVDFSYSEKKFIEKLCNRGFDELDSYIKVVYTDTAGGTARSKSALTPALCENYGISYCSNDIFTAALLDNKMAAYGILKSFNMPLPRTWFYSHKLGWIDSMPPQNMLLIAKPAYGCASAWIDKKSVSHLNEIFIKHIDEVSVSSNQPIMVQEFIKGYEVEVPVFDLEWPFAPGAVGISYENDRSMGDKFFTYDAIFGDGFQLFDFNGIDNDASEKLRDTACKAYSYLQLKGPVRFDYRVDEATGEFFLMDFNNSPHLGRKHSFAQSIKGFGYTYEDMLKLIVYPAIIA